MDRFGFFNSGFMKLTNLIYPVFFEFEFFNLELLNFELFFDRCLFGVSFCYGKCEFIFFIFLLKKIILGFLRTLTRASILTVLTILSILLLFLLGFEDALAFRLELGFVLGV